MSTRILVVEDEAIIARDIRATLKGFGYDVPRPVASGDAAVEAVAVHRPDLVLMDIGIQGDTDGIDAAAAIRDRHGTPVVYLTSYSDEATVARAKATGAYGYVIKPFSDRDLRAAIEVALQKSALEQRLTERERWFATTLNSIGDAVIAADTQQRITFMNAAAERLTGWEAKEAVGSAIGDVLRLVDEKTGAPLDSPLVNAFREGVAIELPRRAALSPKAGSPRAVDDTAAPIIDDKGQTLGGVVVLRDVTERRRLEQRLTQSERLAAIGTLSAGMAHEINNPLAYVLTNVAFAVDGLKEAREQLRTLGGAEADSIASHLGDIEDALEDAREGGTRVHRIVHDLKKFGRLDVAEHTVLDLSDVIESSVRMTENVVRHHAHVRREYKETPFVAANHGQLGQVFTSLLINAAQALGEGLAPKKEITVSTFTDAAGQAVAEVRDSGPGISEEVQRRIFEPFFTTKAVGQGSGLGLSIAHSIVRSLGGEISVESLLGIGTTFRVTLPAANRRASTKAPPTRPASVRRGRVLVIDDEPAIGRALSRVLQREHDVFVVTDPQEALPRIEAGERFDVMFCDLMMPGMTGMDFLEALRDRDPDLARRIVFVTGGAFTPRTQEFLDSTGNAVLTKPVDPIALHRIIADYVGSA